MCRSAESLGRLDLRCAALILLANVNTKQGRAAESRRNLTDAVASAAEIGDRALQVRALYEFGYFAAWFEGASEAGIAQVRDALAIAETLDDRALRIEGHMRIGTLCFNVGDLAGAQEALERAARLASELGQLRRRTRSLTLLSPVLYYRGQVDEAVAAGPAGARLARANREHLSPAPEPSRACAVRARAGDLGARRGSPPDRGPDRPRGRRLARDRDMTDSSSRRLCGRGGSTKRASSPSSLRETCRPKTPMRRPRSVSPRPRSQPRTASRIARSRASTRLFRLLREQRLLTDLGEARIAFARTLRTFGDTAKSRDELKRAREAFARMDAHQLVLEIDRELAEAVTGADVIGPGP